MDKQGGGIIIFRKKQMVRRSIKQLEFYFPEKWENLSDFLENVYLVDVDLYSPVTYEMFH